MIEYCASIEILYLPSFSLPIQQNNFEPFYSVMVTSTFPDQHKYLVQLLLLVHFLKFINIVSHLSAVFCYRFDLC